MAQPHPTERPRTREEVFRRVVEVLLAQEKKPLRIAVFGSWARGEQRPDSDLDVVVDVDYKGVHYSLFDLMRHEQLVAEALGMPVDMHTADSLKPQVRAVAEREQIVLYP